jgi:hypothetical protein
MAQRNKKRKREKPNLLVHSTQTADKALDLKFKCKCKVPRAKTGRERRARADTVLFFVF